MPAKRPTSYATWRFTSEEVAKTLGISRGRLRHLKMEGEIDESLLSICKAYARRNVPQNKALPSFVTDAVVRTEVLMLVEATARRVSRGTISIVSAAERIMRLFDKMVR
jgi:hypothetical protein